MTPLKQLLRQPVRLIAILLLLGMASAFSCLSAGVFDPQKRRSLISKIAM